MKSVIDCNGVFEVLTQAPFPTGRSNDQEVENHLRACHECRQLAEALRPAVGLIHESLADDSSLPRYDGQLAFRVAQRESNSRWTKQLVALVSAGLAACLLTWLSSNVGTQRARMISSAGRNRSVAPDAAGMITLDSLPLAPACFMDREQRAAPWRTLEVAAKPLIDADDSRFACCTQCHHVHGSGPASDRAMRALDAACAACHRPAANATARQGRFGRTLARRADCLFVGDSPRIDSSGTA